MITLTANTAQLLATDPGQIYGRATLAHLPRLLGQIDRNPHSPTYGSCCRNFWHYRIEDISNSQMQEVVLALALAYKLDADWNPYAGAPQLLVWIEAALRYWTTLQRPSGSFDEVYRGQDSYAATAFTAYCASEATLLLQDELDGAVTTAVCETLDRAVRWLDETEESLACNQIAGATAAAVNAFNLTGAPAHETSARQTLARLQDRQRDEGWFNEYGGADIGYSSLTLDYLAKIWRATGWEEAQTMAVRLLDFLTYFIHRDGTGGGVHGSRNTEYIIPHGIELLAPEHGQARSISNLLLTSMNERPSRSVLNRLDDRYLCYLSGFFMQAAAAAVPRDDLEIDLPCTRPHSHYFPAAGLWSVANDAFHLVANVAKGGVIRCDAHDGRTFQDSGLFVEQDRGDVYTSQALTTPADAAVEGTRATVTAPLVRLKHITISPWRALAFKGYNLAVPGALRRLALDLVRRRAVSSGAALGAVRRTIELAADALIVEDSLTLPAGSFRLRLALLTERAFSFASSGFFHPAELEEPGSQAWETTLDGPTTFTLRRTLTGDGWMVER